MRLRIAVVVLVALSAACQQRLGTSSGRIGRAGFCPAACARQPFWPFYPVGRQGDPG